MLLHSIKLFIRDLFRNKTYALINIIGLGIALACAFLILLFIINEVSFDSFHKNKESVFRVNSILEGEDEGVFTMSSTSILLRENIIKDLPDIKKATRVFNYSRWGDKQLVQKNDDFIYENKFLLVDNDFFDIFSFQIVNGPTSNPLVSKESLLISKTAASKYFDREDPIGKTLFIKNNLTQVTFQIVGVFQDLPTNTVFQADFIGNVEIIEPFYRERGWGLTNQQTYVLLGNHGSVNDVEAKLEDFSKKHHPQRSLKYSLQKLSDIYFNSGNFKWYDLPQGDKANIYLFAAIALLIVIVAGINYVILSTAKGIGRTVEVGIRKVVGATRGSIFKLSLFESLFFVTLILPLSIMISELLLPTMNTLLNRNLRIDYFNNWPYLLGLILLTVSIGFFSGCYVSIFLSKFQPEDILKRKFTTKLGKSSFKRGLMVVQLIVFVTLFVFTGVIYKQLQFIKSSDIGFKPENLLIINPPHNHELTSCLPFVNSIKDNPMLKTVSEVSSGIFTPYQRTETLINPDYPNDTIIARGLSADKEFVNAFDIQIIEGVGFSDSISSNSRVVLLNQTAAKQLKLNNSIESFIRIGIENYRVIGVTKDFNVESLHQQIMPVAIFQRSEDEMVCQVAIKYNKNVDLMTLLPFIESQWNEFGPKSSIDFFFMDDKLKDQYRNDKNFSETIELFTIITILIAVLGLFGFSLFTSKQRTKEVGIRKVYGASSGKILVNFIKDNTRILVIANIIAWPLSYYITTNWLQNFAFRINFPYSILAFAFLVSLIIVVTIVSVNTLQTARMNPVDSLRYE